MVSVRKRGKVYEYRFEVATVDGAKKWFYPQAGNIIFLAYDILDDTICGCGTPLY